MLALRPARAAAAAVCRAARPTLLPLPPPLPARRRHLASAAIPARQQQQQQTDAATASASPQQPHAQVPLPPTSRDPAAFPAAASFQDDFRAASAASSPAAAPAPPAPADATAAAAAAAAAAAFDLTVSFHGASAEPFPQTAVDVLLSPIPSTDIEIKPDGMIYLPEIKYRRILNRAFGPGGWGLVPRGPHTVGAKTVSREYALFCLGRFVSVARGEQDYFGAADGLPTAAEGCKSNSLMRCCKDLGVASELWDPAFIRAFRDEHCVQVWASTASGQRKLLWRRKDRSLDYPYREDQAAPAGAAASAARSSTYRK
ncbi:hypothetical protein HK405_001466 [Cladochytrium tenue]|nr:hypothetical protein HK405_001466 [Cladochytrium tenue]